jgi:hypothetical protein
VTGGAVGLGGRQRHVHDPVELLHRLAAHRDAGVDRLEPDQAGNRAVHFYLGIADLGFRFQRKRTGFVAQRQHLAGVPRGRKVESLVGADHGKDDARLVGVEVGLKVDIERRIGIAEVALVERQSSIDTRESFFSWSRWVEDPVAPPLLVLLRFTSAPQGHLRQHYESAQKRQQADLGFHRVRAEERSSLAQSALANVTFHAEARWNQLHTAGSFRR